VKDHAADAGGDAAILRAKRELREEIWSALTDAGVTRFPGARGRIPNFIGAEAAAERLRDTDCWRDARTLKSNPDSPQWPVRQRALEDGIVLYMAVPRLTRADPFFVLDPRRLDEGARAASSIKGASRLGRTVPLSGLKPVDLVVTGSVGVDRAGARLGKGGGFSDLEYAVAAAAGLIGPQTLIATTVHPLQLVGGGSIPMTAHDVPLDLVVTPDEVIACHRRHDRPKGVMWEHLTEEKLAAVPVLAAMRGEERR
jgi:5-formyltetrahydrofolate cyclo-ligase